MVLLMEADDVFPVMALTTRSVQYGLTYLTTTSPHSALLYCISCYQPSRCEDSSEARGAWSCLLSNLNRASSSSSASRSTSGFGKG